MPTATPAATIFPVAAGAPSTKHWQAATGKPVADALIAKPYRLQIT
jgi:hypothetical protein